MYFESRMYFASISLGRFFIHIPEGTTACYENEESGLHFEWYRDAAGNTRRA